jgi:1-acyl-sn-glycerol-3-phosphate acyltransferase
MFTIVLMTSIKSIPFYGALMKLSRAIFIDRSRSEGNAGKICEGIRNKTSPPIALAPEGKISNGSLTFKFRTGAFLTDEPFQPVALRYYRLFPWVGGTVQWLVSDMLEYAWGIFSSPGYVCEMTFLPQFTTADIQGKSPEEKAEMAQLAVSNCLGTLASDKSTKDFFQAGKPKDE